MNCGTMTTAAMVASMAAGAQAACTAPQAAEDLTQAELRALYDCAAAGMHEGYMTGPKRWIPAEQVAAYRDWRAASVAPAAPGFHGGRYLMTFVNPVGYDEYTRFAEDDAAMPAGSVIAKESFAIGDDGTVKPGPLFFMAKVAAGASPETNDWHYYAVSAKGAPMAVDAMTACNACHMENFGYRDNLGYPVEDVRVVR